MSIRHNAPIGSKSLKKHNPIWSKLSSTPTHKHLYDAEKGVFVSGTDKQVSYCSQAWMILSGVASNTEGVTALKNVEKMENVVRPGAPYLYHYVIEAMIQVGMAQEAKDLLTNYWGDMVKKGADTFWEVYDPKNDFLSPYNAYLVNSYCHAWRVVRLFILFVNIRRFFRNRLKNCTVKLSKLKNVDIQ